MSRCEGCVFLGEYSDMGFYAKCCDHNYHYTRSLNNAIEMCKKGDPCEHKVTFDEVYEYEKRRGATADVVEVRHGYNTMRCNSMFECSVCGWQDFDTFLADSDFYFCPHCGAKMEERYENL